MSTHPRRGDLAGLAWERVCSSPVTLFLEPIHRASMRSNHNVKVKASRLAQLAAAPSSYSNKVEAHRNYQANAEIIPSRNHSLTLSEKSSRCFRSTPPNSTGKLNSTCSAEPLAIYVHINLRSSPCMQAACHQQAHRLVASAERPPACAWQWRTSSLGSSHIVPPLPASSSGGATRAFGLRQSPCSSRMWLDVDWRRRGCFRRERASRRLWRVRCV